MLQVTFPAGMKAHTAIKLMIHRGDPGARADIRADYRGFVLLEDLYYDEWTANWIVEAQLLAKAFGKTLYQDHLGWWRLKKSVYVRPVFDWER